MEGHPEVACSFSDPSHLVFGVLILTLGYGTALGEGALLALGGSSVGVGTDIGKQCVMVPGAFIGRSYACLRWLCSNSCCILWGIFH